MPAETYPQFDVGRETGVPPSQIRIGGRYVSVVGAVIEGEVAYFDNGVLASKSKAEKGIAFGPEVLRAVGGKRVLALWLAASREAPGSPAGWYGLTVGEMRIDAAKKEGYRDVNSFQTKLTDAAKGRVAVWQLKEPEKTALIGLLEQKPELWVNAAKSFRDTLLSSVPGAAAVGGSAAAEATAVASAAAAAPVLTLGTEGGFRPTTMRSGGREVVLVGCVVEGGTATWDNGLLSGKSKVEQGINFGPEVLRAVGGRRVCGVWVSVTRDAEGRGGWYGASVGEMRIDAAKKEGFRDVSAWSMKLNDSARGRVDLWRLKPEEKKAVQALLEAQAELWEYSAETIRTSLS